MIQEVLIPIIEQEKEANRRIQRETGRGGNRALTGVSVGSCHLMVSYTCSWENSPPHIIIGKDKLFFLILCWFYNLGLVKLD